jgi:hypothetical protein
MKVILSMFQDAIINLSGGRIEKTYNDAQKVDSTFLFESKWRYWFILSKKTITMEHYFEGKNLNISNNKYWILSSEISGLSSTQLMDAISDMESVFNGKWMVNTFCGQHMSCVEHNKDTARITYFDEFIGEESTKEIYNMLKEYKDRLIE